MLTVSAFLPTFFGALFGFASGWGLVPIAEWHKEKNLRKVAIKNLKGELKQNVLSFGRLRDNIDNNINNAPIYKVRSFHRKPYLNDPQFKTSVIKSIFESGIVYRILEEQYINDLSSILHRIENKSAERHIEDVINEWHDGRKENHKSAERRFVDHLELCKDDCEKEIKLIERLIIFIERIEIRSFKV